MHGTSKGLCTVLAGSALVLAAGFSTAMAEDSGEIMELELSVLGSFSTSNLYPDYEQPFWNETLPEASGGKITAKLQAFDLLGLKGNAVYDLVSQGVYDAGTTVMDYVAGVIPVVEGADIPAIADPGLMHKMIDAYRPALNKAFDETYDARLMAVLPFSTQVVFCNTPISGLEDLAGKRIRGSGRMTLDFIEAVGATGVSVAFNEVPVAMERGVIECGVTGSLSGYLAGWSEVATHFYPLTVGGWDSAGIILRNDVWNSFNKATQDLLTAQFAKLEDTVWGDIDRVLDAGIACNTGGDCPYGEPQDLTLVKVTDADLKKARKLTEAKVLPQWAERCGEECIAFWNKTAGEVLGISAGAK